MPKETPEQPSLISEPGSEYKITPEEQAHKDKYHQRLREYLNEPEFRKTPGFPIGDDEAILELSDPPYYAACPNPFLPEIIEEWQKERIEIRQELGLPDDSVGNEYHREPFAADVSEGKNNPIYNAHSYHTKVPHPAIMRYILHYTEPGDIVFDGFCGTGMTGVAAQLCGDRNEVIEKLGYYVDEDGKIYEKFGDLQPISILGVRKTILNDLSPAATFISYNYNKLVDIKEFEREAKRLLRDVEKESGWMYETWHPHCDALDRVKGKIQFVIWSDVFICPDCNHELIFWDIAVDRKKGTTKKEFTCSNCSSKLSKRKIERAWETKFDRYLGKSIQVAKQVPVKIKYSVGNKKYEKNVDSEDINLIQKTNEFNASLNFPITEVPDGYNTKQPRISHGMTHSHHFYTPRNLLTLNSFFRMSLKSISMHQMLFILTSAHQYCVRLCRLHVGNYFNKKGGVVDKPLEGTLYMPSLSVETNAIYRLQLRSRLSKVFQRQNTSAIIETKSSTQYDGKQFADYIFVDPPFGGNRMYSELNFLWESWLGVLTNNKDEAIINNVQKKDISDYQVLMEQCFQQFFFVLKPGRWITVEFSNTLKSVWNAIQEALLKAGFVVADVRSLDKGKGTFKQVTTTSAVKQDLIISAYKPRTDFEYKFKTQAGTSSGAWTFIRQHLSQLPIVVQNNGVLEILNERQAYLLFDRMVAFHVQRGISVPLSAMQFHAGLDERFPKRDGMYFLPEQIPEYDRTRLEVESVAQLALFVSDEKTAIQWLRQKLDPQIGGNPQIYQDIQPEFLKQLHQAKYEVLPELNDLLVQNFLQDESGVWYVPDPSKASDLEKIRRKTLLREFNQYLESKSRLKQFRTEAIRAGFAESWHRKDFETIVKIANRLPETVLQEDPDLLMYYDNASLRES